jgi:hypothetical protein
MHSILTVQSGIIHLELHAESADHEIYAAPLCATPYSASADTNT